MDHVIYRDYIVNLRFFYLLYSGHSLAQYSTSQENLQELSIPIISELNQRDLVGWLIFSLPNPAGFSCDKVCLTTSQVEEGLRDVEVSYQLAHVSDKHWPRSSAVRPDGVRTAVTVY